MRERKLRVRTMGRQAFNVPCNEEGRIFLRSMRKFINRPRWRFSARGRGPRAIDGHNSVRYQLCLPQDKSEWLAVYLGGRGSWGTFHAVMDPDSPLHRYQLLGSEDAVDVARWTTPAPKLTPEEQALLDTIMEEAEERYDSEEFYSVLQKLVDI